MQHIIYIYIYTHTYAYIYTHIYKDTYHTMPCHAMPCHAMPCHAIPYLAYHTHPPYLPTYLRKQMHTPRCVHLCVRVNMHMHLCIHVYVHTRVQLYIYIYIYTHIHSYTKVCLRRSMFMCACMCPVCKCVYARTCMHMYMLMRVCAYTCMYMAYTWHTHGTGLLLSTLRLIAHGLLHLVQFLPSVPAMSEGDPVVPQTKTEARASLT